MRCTRIQAVIAVSATLGLVPRNVTQFAWSAATRRASMAGCVLIESNADCTVLHGTVVSAPPQNSQAGPRKLRCVLAPHSGALAVILWSPDAVLIAKPPWEWPVAP